jgi:hypothetical protein
MGYPKIVVFFVGFRLKKKTIKILLIDDLGDTPWLRNNRTGLVNDLSRPTFSARHVPPSFGRTSGHLYGPSGS